MRRLAVAALLLAVLLGAGYLADRAVAGWAEGYVAEQIAEQAGLAEAPDVDVRGLPFLGQAVEGRYDDVRIALSARQLGQPAGTSADVRLRGVRLPLSTVLSGEVQEIPVDRVDGTATLSWALLSEQLGGDATLRRDGDGVRVARTVELLGYTLPLTASGTVHLDGRDVVIDVEEAAGAGVQVPGFLVERAADLLDLRYRVPELPFGLRLTGATATDAGVRVRLEATDTVLAPPD